MFKNLVKSLLFVSTIYSFSFAGLVDGVSVIVNNSPITLYELKDYSVKYNLPLKEALNLLIRDKIEENLIKKYGLEADDLEVDDELEKISSNAGMSIVDFENYLQKKGVDLDEYKKDLAKKIAKRKLYKKIVSNKIRRADESEIKAYYKKHIDIYSIPQMVEVREYHSKDRDTLKQMIKNPMLNVRGIVSQDKVLKANSINPKLLYILQQTKEGSFTPILTLKNDFITFYVKRKINVKPIPYERVKNSIFATIMDKREKDIIKSYFDKLISEANIKVVREPR